MALLQVEISNAMGGGEMRLEIGGGVESCTALGAGVVDMDVAAPHLGLAVVSELVLAPLVGRRESFATEKGAAVGFV